MQTLELFSMQLEHRSLRSAKETPLVCRIARLRASNITSHRRLEVRDGSTPLRHLASVVWKFRREIVAKRKTQGCIATVPYRTLTRTPIPASCGAAHSNRPAKADSIDIGVVWRGVGGCCYPCGYLRILHPPSFFFFFFLRVRVMNVYVMGIIQAFACTRPLYGLYALYRIHSRTKFFQCFSIHRYFISNQECSYSKSRAIKI